MEGYRSEYALLELKLPISAGSEQDGIDCVIGDAIGGVLHSEGDEVPACLGWEVVSVTDEETQLEELE